MFCFAPNIVYIIITGIVLSHALCMGHKTGNRTSMQAGWPSNIICSINLKVHF